jgi:hypothetical protein
MGLPGVEEQNFPCSLGQQRHELGRTARASAHHEMVQDAEAGDHVRGARLIL